MNFRIKKTSLFKAVASTVIMVCLFVSDLKAQSEVDAVRYTFKQPSIGARAMGMGSAYLAVSNDFSALYTNPAGLGLLKKSEAALGFNTSSILTESEYLSTKSEIEPGTTSLDMLGAAIPVPTIQGSFTVAFGYTESANFEAGQNISAFNSTQSINNYFLNAFSPTLDDSDPPRVLLNDQGALAFDTWLQDVSDDGSAYMNPQISNGEVLQHSDLQESGGINMYSIAASIEVAKDIFLGGALNVYSGEYRYYRLYEEMDSQGVYERFKHLAMEEYLTTDISGYNFKLGLLYKIDDTFNFGLTIETPIYYDLNDTYSTSLSTEYDVAPEGADQTSFYSELSGEFSYTLDTPFRFATGLSYYNDWVTLSAQAEWMDWSQMEYDGDSNYLKSVNRVIQSELQGAYSLAAGVEFSMPGSDIYVRGGYRFEQSPYKYKLSNPNRKTGYDEAYKTFSLGLGINMKSSLALDLAYQQTSYMFENGLYGFSQIVTDNVTLSQLQLTGRFWF